MHKKLAIFLFCFVVCASIKTSLNAAELPMRTTLPVQQAQTFGVQSGASDLMTYWSNPIITHASKIFAQPSTLEFVNCKRYLFVTGIEPVSRKNYIALYDIPMRIMPWAFGPHKLVPATVSARDMEIVLAKKNLIGFMDIYDPKQKRLFYAPSNVSSLALSPDEQTLVYGSPNGRIGFIDPATEQEIKYYNSAIVEPKVLFCSDNVNVAAWNSRSIIIIDSITGQLKTLESDKDIRAAAFSPKEPILAFCCDKSITLWNFMTDKKRELNGHSDCVVSLAFSPDGTILASGSADKTIKLWGVQTGGAITTITGHGAAVTAVTFAPRGELLASGSLDSMIRLWQTESVGRADGFSVLVSNANVSIDTVKLVERDGTERAGVPRELPANETATWHIPNVRPDKGPYKFEITVQGNTYRWNIESIEEGFGDDLTLIEKSIGFEIELRQGEEKPEAYSAQLIPQE